VSTRGWSVGGLLVAALAVGTVSDVAPAKPMRKLGGYHVLAADFHVHSFPSGWAMLSPCDTAVEAGRQGLDVIVLTPHDEVWAAKLGRWCSSKVDGPMVIVGEEITSARYHMIAAGISEAIDSRQAAARAIDEVHRQGGIAIAAHPYESAWPAYDAEALSKLDGAEVVRAESKHVAKLASQLRAFFARADTTAIGSSDYHGLGTVGYSRTYVFARERTERAVLDAVREGRTVVFDGDRAFGDPTLVGIALESGLPREFASVEARPRLRRLSAIVTLAVLAAVLLFNRWAA